MLDPKNKDKIYNILCKHGYNIENIEIDSFYKGGNNKIIIINTDKNTILAKKFFPDAHDRLKSELNFLNYALGKGIQCVPHLIDYDLDEKIALYEFIDGEKPLAEEITLKDIDQAADFFSQLNQHVPHKKVDLPFAAEACFSINDHFLVIDQRIEKLRKTTPVGLFKNEYKDLIYTFYEAWEVLKIKISSLARENGIKMDSLLDKESWCISPSDFGFHNSIRLKSGKLYFIDFEYAGWDDPSKMVSDFFLQPAVSVGSEYFEHFMDKVFTYLHEKDTLKTRTRLLYPMFSIKWGCIILNCFVPEFLKRTLFSDPHKDINLLQEDRLKKAQLYLAHGCL